MLSLTSLTENIVNFKTFEEKINQKVKNIGSNSIKISLEELDNQILKERDKKVFRNKGKKRIDLKTTLAEVEVYRRVYIIDEKELEEMEDKENNLMYKIAKSKIESGCKAIYLLDEMLNLRQYGKLTESVVEIILRYIQDNSYRKTAQIVNEITGLKISATCVWNVVQLIGNMLKTKEKEEMEKSENDLIECKNKENHILFKELDGVYFTMQGKDKKEAIELYKKSHPESDVPKSVRKKELKIVSIYEGWKKEAKNRNTLVNKKIFAQVIDNCKIKKVMNMYIDNTYNKENLKLIVTNSDGGTWTKEKTKGKKIYQLDWFHVKQMVNRQVREKEDRKILIKYLTQKEYDNALNMCEELKYKYDGEVNEIKKLDMLKEYINKNKGNFIRYQETEEFKKIKQDNFIYNNLGTQESTNYSKITKRMKRRRMSFSIEGADNLARVIAMVGSYDYEGISKAFEIQVLPQKAIDEAEEYIKNIEKNIREQNKKRRKVSNIKYNDSFNTHIPGIEYNKYKELIEVKKLVFG